jgi:hypothetical protein
VRRTALDIEAAIKRDMASEKHGRTYGEHVASARGEAPAIDTGVLVNSVQTSMDGAYAAEVGSPQETAPILETTLDRPAWRRAGEGAGNIFRRNAGRMR